MTTQYEAVVIGGGPAGCAASLALARRGRRVLVVERRRFPRFHIGESMLPASNEVFRRLGLEDELRGGEFVEKRGASFWTEDGETSSYIDFTGCPLVKAPVTYQVLRSRFDQILLDAALSEGVEICQEERVSDVAWEDERLEVEIAGVAGGNGHTGRRSVSAEVLVDASGQAGFLSKRLDLRRGDPKMRNVALYAHFEGVGRPPGERSGDIRIVSLRDMGWIWFIPVSAEVTSVGLVSARERLAERGGRGNEEFLDDLLASVPAAAEQMRGARRLSEVHVEADFSYSPRAYAGDRWLLVGDAGSFLDPVFSTGVLLALESGLEAAEAIDAALAKGDPSARSFAAFERIQRRRFRYFRRFVRGFYDPAFRDLFFTPTNRFGMLDAIVSALAGNWRPPLGVRLRLELFFALVIAQRFLPLAPRSHSA